MGQLLIWPHYYIRFFHNVTVLGHCRNCICTKLFVVSYQSIYSLQAPIQKWVMKCSCLSGCLKHNVLYLTIWQRKIPPHTRSNTQNTTKKDYILNYICSFFSGEKGIPNCRENMDTLTSSMNMEFACIITLRVFVYYVCWHDSLGFVINYCPTSDWAMPCPSIRWWISQ